VGITNESSDLSKKIVELVASMWAHKPEENPELARIKKGIIMGLPQMLQKGNCDCSNTMLQLLCEYFIVSEATK